MIFVSFLLIALFVLVSVVEYRLEKSWDRTYYRVGIPVYRFRFHTSQELSPLREFIPDLDASTTSMMRTPRSFVTYQSVLGHELFFDNGYKIGFSWRRRLEPTPHHGRIFYDSQKRECTVTGYYPWTVLAAQLMLLSIFFSDGYPDFEDVLILVVFGLGSVFHFYQSYSLIARAAHIVLG